MPNLLEVSTFELMKLWGELIEAWYGKASHGHVIEIYSYRLAAPSIYANLLPESTIAHQEYEARAIRLHALLTLFDECYECKSISIGVNRDNDGTLLSPDWERCIPTPFDYRVHVKVTPHV